MWIEAGRALDGVKFQSLALRMNLQEDYFGNKTCFTHAHSDLVDRLPGIGSSIPGVLADGSGFFGHGV